MAARGVLQRRIGLPALGAAVLLVPSAAVVADAAAPPSGTITDTSTSVTWSAGPFLTPNTTGAATGTPLCTAPTMCDDFALHVSTPPGYGTGHQLSITVSWPVAAADFDIYVLDSAGNTLDTSASSADPELVL